MLNFSPGKARLTQMLHDAAEARKKAMVREERAKR